MPWAKKKKKPLVLRKSVSIPRLKKQSRMKYSKSLFIWIQTHSPLHALELETSPAFKTAMHTFPPHL